MLRVVCTLLVLALHIHRNNWLLSSTHSPPRIEICGQSRIIYTNSHLRRFALTAVISKSMSTKFNHLTVIFKDSLFQKIY